MSHEVATSLIGLAALAVRYYAALLLAGAAVGKLRRPADTLRAVSAYRVLPDAFVSPAALALPLVELAAALGLVLMPHPAAAWGAALLFAVFAAAVGVNLARGRRALDCGCGFGHRKIGPDLALHNVVLALLLLAGAHQSLPLAPLTILLALLPAAALLALVLGLATLNAIETPAKRLKAR